MSMFYEHKVKNLLKNAIFQQKINGRLQVLQDDRATGADHGLQVLQDDLVEVRDPEIPEVP